MSTRLIGGVIMTHGDNNGLVLPPRIAPTQVIIIPVAQHKEGVLEANEAVMNRLKSAGIRVKMDASEQSAGWKFAEYEMKGVPLRLEMGPKDMEKNQCVLARRDNGEKSFVSLDNIEETVKTMLDAVQQGLFDKAKKNLEDNTYACSSLEEVKEKMASQGGFAKTMWCGDLECELEDEGRGRRLLPLHPPGAGAPGRRVPHLRQERQAHGVLGRGVLKYKTVSEISNEGRPTGTALVCCMESGGPCQPKSCRSPP